MKKIFSSLVMFSMVVSMLGTLPLVANAIPVSCDVTKVTQTQTIVSDTTTLQGSNPTVPVSPTNVLWTSIPGATWIWGETLSDADALTGTTETFTRTFNIIGTPLDSTLEIAADNTFSVSVNGNAVGSDLTEFNYGATKTYPIPAADLLTGSNTITFTVANLPLADSSALINPAGLLYKLVVNENDCQTPPPPTTVTINATKIVCPTEDLLPNWGAGDSTMQQITSNTASRFLTTHPTCHTADWTFEWAPSSATNPGDNTPQVAGAPWVPFTSTFTIPTPADSSVWVREQTQDGYIPFSGATTNLNDTASKNSAEIYCNTDVLNYDNFDRVDNMVAGGTYNCVAFNVPTTPAPVCDAKQELLTNGSFESPVVTNSALWDIFPSGTSTLAWLASWINPSGAPTIANVEIQKNGLNGGWMASDGIQWTELDSDYFGPSNSGLGHPAVAISQSIVTIPSDNYTVSFDFSARPGTGAAENVVEVLANNVVIGTVGPTDGTSLTNTAWTPHSFNFTATGALTTIALRDAGTSNDSLGTFVDNVSLKCVPRQEQPPTVKVTIAKYLDEVAANGTSANNTEFPMEATWVTTNFSSGTGNYGLGPVGFNNPNPYQATTADMNNGADYTTHEITTLNDVNSPVVPTDSQSCPAGKYRLLGYKSGTSLANAEAATLSTTAPAFTGLSADQYVIVVNTPCPSATPTGTIQITKYECPTNTVVTRDANGVGGTVPEGCTLETGATFGYVHGTQTDANSPFPELTASLTAGGSTNGSGVLTIPNLGADGRYLVVETNSSNQQLPAGDILGLYCAGDGDTSGTNDNQELTFVTANQTTQCVAYNKLSTARITIVKNTVGGDGTFHFTGLGGGNGFDLTTNSENNHSASSFFDVFPEVDGSSYTITEGSHEGWNLNISCDYEDHSIGTPVTNGETVTVEPGDHVTCTFTNTLVPNPGSPSSDLRMEKTVDKESASVGDTVTFTLTVTNDGPDSATGVTVSDVLPAGLTLGTATPSVGTYISGTWTIGNLAVGNANSATLTITATVNNNVSGQNIINTASISHSDTNDGNTENNTHSATVNIKTQCSDGIDNDSDQLIDANDPGCHSDGNVSNADSYVPSDNDETNPADVCSNIDGIQETVPGGMTESGGICTTITTFSHGGGRLPTSGLVLGASTGPQGQVLGAETSCGIYLDKYLQKGRKNNPEAVKKVQQFLNDYLQAGLTVDGKFGAKTDKFVRQFQASHKVKVLDPWNLVGPTGIVYLTTQTEINNIMCPALNLPIPTNLIPTNLNPDFPVRG